MELDLSRLPFTRFGSYLAFSLLDAGAAYGTGLYLRSVRGPATGGRPLQEVLRLDPVRAGQALSFQVRATFTQLTLTCPDGQAEICFPSPQTIRIRLRGLGLRFQMSAGAYDHLFPADRGRWRLTVNTVVETRLQFTPLQGQIAADAPWQDEHSAFITITLLPGAGGEGEFAIEEGVENWPDGDLSLPFDDCCQQAAVQLNEFIASLPVVPERYASARELAGYVLWSCVVAPSERLTRPAVYASKNGMIGLWSWDHVFHWAALTTGHPDLAWDQLMAIFDHQHESGALPDLINDRLVSWSFCKPPVHGYLLARMEQRGALLSASRLQELYPRLARWTEWWLTQRDEDGDGLPECHHGNDSGWDNSTIFAVRPPIESPDIAAYLVLQMEYLAQAARRLGREAEAEQWQRRSQVLLRQLLQRFWRGDHFVAYQHPEHKPIEAQSLQLYLPLILGQRLPEEVRAALIARLKSPGLHLTPFGLATESLNSPYYRARGYWRGPIWPAPTMILCDALAACGEKAFAADLRRRFCDLVQEAGMAENFDAQTGQGYHDFHFSWTAGIFLLLAHEMADL